MPDKTVPLSVRMSSADMGMLSSLNIPEAVTPSEKLRRLVRTAYRQQQGRSNYGDALKVEEERLGPLLHKIRAVEAEQKVHSELLVYLLGWLPDLTATVMSALAEIEKEEDGERGAGALAVTEAAVADRIFGLMLTVLQFSLTPKTHFYSEQTAAERLPEIVEIARLLNRKPTRSKTKGKGEKHD
jgi:hypothetical protein